MFDRRVLPLLISPLLLATALQGCRRAADAPSNAAGPSPGAATSAPAPGNTIETEIVTAQTVAGAITATGLVICHWTMRVASRVSPVASRAVTSSCA